MRLLRTRDELGLTRDYSGEARGLVKVLGELLAGGSDVVLLTSASFRLQVQGLDSVHKADCVSPACLKPKVSLCGRSIIPSIWIRHRQQKFSLGKCLHDLSWGLIGKI